LELFWYFPTSWTVENPNENEWGHQLWVQLSNLRWRSCMTRHDLFTRLAVSQIWKIQFTLEFPSSTIREGEITHCHGLRWAFDLESPTVQNLPMGSKENANSPSEISGKCDFDSYLVLGYQEKKASHPTSNPLIASRKNIGYDHQVRVAWCIAWHHIFERNFGLDFVQCGLTTKFWWSFSFFEGSFVLLNWFLVCW